VTSLRLPGDALVDVTAVPHGSWPAAVDLPGRAAFLLGAGRPFTPW
jgi:hypothetical protein